MKTEPPVEERSDQQSINIPIDPSASSSSERSNRGLLGYKDIPRDHQADLMGCDMNIVYHEDYYQHKEIDDRLVAEDSDVAALDGTIGPANAGQPHLMKQTNNAAQLALHAVEPVEHVLDDIGVHQEEKDQQPPVEVPLEQALQSTSASPP